MICSLLGRLLAVWRTSRSLRGFPDRGLGELEMTPEAALAKQVELYRRMSGEDRLKIALDLHAFSCDVAREGIRQQFPQADEDEIDLKLRRRIAAAYQ